MASLIGSGFSKPDAEALPIDIQYTKCVGELSPRHPAPCKPLTSFLSPHPADWLVQRRVVSANWQKSLRVAHSKLAAALTEPRPDVPGMLDVLPPNKQREEVSPPYALHLALPPHQPKHGTHVRRPAQTLSRSARLAR